MTFLPIVARELRVRARQKATHRFRLGGALIAMALVVFMLFMGSAFSSPQSIGQPMFHTLAWLAFGYCLFEGARNTADSLSEEMRNGTLGLLFLTDLRGYDVVLGKLIATSLNSFYGLLAIFPPLALPILIGGVTGGEFWRLVLALINTLFFSLCTGMLVSSISREERKAWGTTLGVLLLFALVPIALRLLPLSAFSWLQGASPALAFYSLFDVTYSVDPSPFDNSIWILQVLSWSFLAVASFLLPRVWQDETVQARKGMIEKFVERLLPARDPLKRTRSRRQLLNVNPVTWLALAQQRSMRFLWLLVGGAGLAGIATWLVVISARFHGQAALPGAMFGTLAVVAILIHLVIALCVATEACNFFPDARSSGALELLLCTPLPVGEIVEGHRQALRHMFAAPVLTFAGLEVVVVAGHVLLAKDLAPLTALLTPVVVGFFIFILIMDLYAAGEYGMWLGLASRKSTQAVTKTVLFVLILPALSAACCFWPVLAIVKNLVLMNYARDQLRRRFRVVATERFTGPEKENDWVLPLPMAFKSTRSDLPRVLPK